MIKAIIFDWGGVLIDHPASGLMKYCAGRLGADADCLADFFDRHSSAFWKNELSENDFWRTAADELKISRPVIAGSLWKEAVRAVFTDKPGMFALVRRLRENGYKTGFLSNTEMPAREYFLEKGYDEYFDACVFSCTAGTLKPEEKIYRLILEKLRVAPEEAVFIDDLKENVGGAEKIGMCGILFDNTNKLKEELKKLQVKI